MGEAILLLSPRKSRRPPAARKVPGAKMTVKEPQGTDNSCSMLACFCPERRAEDTSEGDADKMDKVEFAFRKFDVDGDEFLSWEEFQQVDRYVLVG